MDLENGVKIFRPVRFRCMPNPVREFCEIPAFVHLPPLEAAEVEPLLKVVVKTRQIVNAPMNVFR